MNHRNASTNGQEMTISNGGGTAAEIVDELESIVGDIHRFLHGFCERARLCAAASQPLPSQIDEYEHQADQPAGWRAQREAVEEKIREQVEMLEAAWLRLEAEQREVQLIKEGLANNLASRGGRSTADAGTRSPRRLSVPGGPNASPRSQPTAVHEFERMRQEIQSSRPQYNAMKD